MTRAAAAAPAAALSLAFLAAIAAEATAAPALGAAPASAPPASLRAERLLDRDQLREEGIERPVRLAFDESGALYVLDARARRVVRLALGSRPANGGAAEEGGGPLVFGEDATASSLPHDLVLDRRGSLLVLDRSGGALQAYDSRASYLGARDIDPSLVEETRDPEARLAQDRFGGLWLLAPREKDVVPLDDRLRRRRPGRFLTPEDSLVSPNAVAFLPSGGGWLADRGAGRVFRFEATGRFAGSIVLPESDRGVSSPDDLAADDAGALYVADGGASRIVVALPDGTIRHTRWLSGGDRPWRPTAIAWGGGDRVAVADEGRDEIWIFAVDRETAP